ncbi:hypothetical protein ABPG75_012727 [Micractinium tetrahymenae]
MRAALLLVVAAALWAVYARGGTPAELLTSTPGGLPRERTPQFILLTHDDGVSRSSRDMLRAITDGRQSPNGCPLTATLFAKIGNTDCKALRELYQLGYEVACHTVQHKRLYGANRTFVESEIVGGRAQLAECGVPAEDIVGFRAPYLHIDAPVRQVLAAHGFLYDSSLVEDTLGSSASQGFADRLWPFDMAAGIPINCTTEDGPYGSRRQACEADESYPGLWEVPLWGMGELDGPFHMDPGFSYACMCHASEHSTLEILKAHFDAAYEGNRAPLPLYVHPFFLWEGHNVRQLQQFADYALSKPDVYFITMRQLIAWMKAPIPADELSPEALGCGSPGGAGPPVPAPAPAPDPARRRQLLAVQQK